MPGWKRYAASIAFVVYAVPSAEAQSLNVDLGTEFGAPSNGFAAAGLAGRWNKIGLGATANLLGLTGAATAADVTVVADTDTGFFGGCPGDMNSLNGDNIFSGVSPGWSVTFTNLIDDTYDVYLYGPDHPTVDTGNMTVNGTPVAFVTGDTCALTQGVLYQVVTVVVTGGTLTITSVNAGTGDIPGLAGVQLVSQSGVPVMPGWQAGALAGFLALLGVMRLRVRSRQAAC